MSVVGLTFGSAANAIRPSAANAARVPTSATIRASGRARSYHAKPAASASARTVNAPSCQLIPPPRRRPGAGSSAPPAGVSAPPAPQDAGGLGREVAAAGQDLDRGAVGDHRAVGEQHHTLGERRRELRVMGGDDHRRPEPAPAARLVRVCGPGPSRALARPGTAPPAGRTGRRARPPARAAASPRRTAPADGARAKPPPPRPTARQRRCRRLVGDSSRGRGSRSGSATTMRPGPAGATRPRVGRISPAACRSRVDLPAPFRPISATRSPGADRQRRPRRIAGPERSSCQTRSKSARTPPAPRRPRRRRRGCVRQVVVLRPPAVGRPVRQQTSARRAARARLTPGERRATRAP